MIVAASQAISIVRDQTDAAGLPAANTHTATLWKNGATTAVSVTRTNPTTGVYKFSWTIPADAAENDVFSLRVVDGDGYASTVWEGQVGVIVALDSATTLKLNRIEAVATGTVTGAGTSTEVFVGPSATLTITVDSSGNRSAVVVT